MCKGLDEIPEKDITSVFGKLKGADFLSDAMSALESEDFRVPNTELNRRIRRQAVWRNVSTADVSGMESVAKFFSNCIERSEEWPEESKDRIAECY